MWSVLAPRYQCLGGSRESSLYLGPKLQGDSLSVDSGPCRAEKAGRRVFPKKSGELPCMPKEVKWVGRVGRIKIMS